MSKKHEKFCFLANYEIKLRCGCKLQKYHKTYKKMKNKNIKQKFNNISNT